MRRAREATEGEASPSLPFADDSQIRSAFSQSESYREQQRRIAEKYSLECHEKLKDSSHPSGFRPLVSAKAAEKGLIKLKFAGTMDTPKDQTVKTAPGDGSQAVQKAEAQPSVQVSRFGADDTPASPSGNAENLPPTPAAHGTLTP